MGIRKLKPMTPGQRFMTVSDFAEVTKARPEKSLTKGIHKSGGRNNSGKMTMRYIGGGHKRRYRTIDFKRDKDGQLLAALPRGCNTQMVKSATSLPRKDCKLAQRLCPVRLQIQRLATVKCSRTFRWVQSFTILNCILPKAVSFAVVLEPTLSCWVKKAATSVFVCLPVKAAGSWPTAKQPLVLLATRPT